MSCALSDQMIVLNSEQDARPPNGHHFVVSINAFGWLDVYKKSIVFCRSVEQESKQMAGALESKVADWVFLVVLFLLL